MEGQSTLTGNSNLKKLLQIYNLTVTDIRNLFNHRVRQLKTVTDNKKPGIRTNKFVQFLQSLYKCHKQLGTSWQLPKFGDQSCYVFTRSYESLKFDD